MFIPLPYSKLLWHHTQFTVCTKKNYLQMTSILQLRFLNKSYGNVYFTVFLVQHTTKTNVLWCLVQTLETWLSLKILISHKCLLIGDFQMYFQWLQLHQATSVYWQMVAQATRAYNSIFFSQTARNSLILQLNRPVEQWSHNTQLNFNQKNTIKCGSKHSI